MAEQGSGGMTCDCVGRYPLSLDHINSRKSFKSHYPITTVRTLKHNTNMKGVFIHPIIILFIRHWERRTMGWEYRVLFSHRSIRQVKTEEEYGVDSYSTPLNLAMVSSGSRPLLFCAPHTNVLCVMDLILLFIVTATRIVLVSTRCCVEGLKEEGSWDTRMVAWVKASFIRHREPRYPWDGIVTRRSDLDYPSRWSFQRTTVGESNTPGLTLSGALEDG
ncbi:hypothetical protein BDQ17DRAFT_1327767 [Cyathus striatus]|nr:hypothetical protein BDQ17DRAFT_1327767 [Cyathus striatus]